MVTTQLLGSMVVSLCFITSRHRVFILLYDSFLVKKLPFFSLEAFKPKAKVQLHPYRCAYEHEFVLSSVLLYP